MLGFMRLLIIGVLFVLSTRALELTGGGAGGGRGLSSGAKTKKGISTVKGAYKLKDGGKEYREEQEEKEAAAGTAGGEDEKGGGKPWAKSARGKFFSTKKGAERR
ncbi:hypothetical protein FOZ61_002317 [Perkinsus olseni]|uniref:Secreted protein n=1 Tax=Perkinsus olseni TaxID=32597 RepID=A0A7J6LTL0_PEROL|nr:hypothetical protein FOZ61_002317 [Perkinsus olseni]KAF4668032.1 hypothetical protein FOL46_002189 [Perkinsus olseni]